MRGKLETNGRLCLTRTAEQKQRLRVAYTTPGPIRGLSRAPPAYDGEKLVPLKLNHNGLTCVVVLRRPPARDKCQGGFSILTVYLRLFPSDTVSGDYFRSCAGFPEAFLVPHI